MSFSEIHRVPPGSPGRHGLALQRDVGLKSVAPTRASLRARAISAQSGPSCQPRLCGFRPGRFGLCGGVACLVQRPASRLPLRVSPFGRSEISRRNRLHRVEVKLERGADHFLAVVNLSPTCLRVRNVLSAVIRGFGAQLLFLRLSHRRFLKVFLSWGRTISHTDHHGGSLLDGGIIRAT